MTIRSAFSILIGFLWLGFIIINPATQSDGLNLVLYAPACFFISFCYVIFFVFLEKSYDNNILGVRIKAIKYFIFAILMIFFASWLQTFILDLSYSLLQGYRYGWLVYATRIMLLIQVAVSLGIIGLFLKLNQTAIHYSKKEFILSTFIVVIVGIMFLPFIVQYKVASITETEHLWYHDKSHKLPTNIEECNKYLTGVRNSCIHEFKVGKFY